jgi:hypothetical protein
MSSSIEIEGGKKCKSYQRRSRQTGRCRNISGSRKMSPRSKSSRSRRVRGGEIVPTTLKGGEITETSFVIEGGGEKRSRSPSRDRKQKLKDIEEDPLLNGLIQKVTSQEDYNFLIYQALKAKADLKSNRQWNKNSWDVKDNITRRYWKSVTPLMEKYKVYKYPYIN